MGLFLAYQTTAALRRHIKPNERIHGVITDGGTVPNIAPERAAARFFVRAETAKDLTVLRARVVACLESGAQASGAQLELISPEPDCLGIIHGTPLCEAFQRNAQALGRVFIPRDHPACRHAASTDMGNVSHYEPATHPYLAAAPADCMIHNAEFAHWAGSEMGDQGDRWRQSVGHDGHRPLHRSALAGRSRGRLRRSP